MDLRSGHVSYDRINCDVQVFLRRYGKGVLNEIGVCRI